ncbi:MAG TPA: hydrogenase maturation nickel metallochaperone HypA [Leptolyngbyaceae cyanobacterium M65_K2018_010]|nr:hydrogenase maturation nickel metallochaperone HypA [Leptolyngbyaceae cyanobacterium M65_K2018_010]
MHELGITQTIVAIAVDHAGGARVRRIALEIGQLSAVMPEAIRFCFDVCAQGTVVEGATLEILEPSGLGQCRQCGQRLALSQPFGVCPCGSTQVDIIQGQELNLKEMEID